MKKEEIIKIIKAKKRDVIELSWNLNKEVLKEMKPLMKRLVNDDNAEQDDFTLMEQTKLIQLRNTQEDRTEGYNWAVDDILKEISNL